MTYKKYDIITVLVWVILGAALIVLGLFLRRPAFGKQVWEVVMGVGIALAAVGTVSIVSSIRQTEELQCPHCGGRVVPRVRSSTSELYLTTVEEKQEEETEEAEEEAKEEQPGEASSAQDETRSPEA